MAVEDPTKKQTEQVDPEVAEILGLEDNFDLDQEEYITLLREKMTELDMKSSQVSSKGGDTKKISQSQSLLIDEFKRVKKLKGSTFTAPKKTVNADSFFGKKKEDQNKGPAQKPITDAAKLLPASGSAITKYQKPEKLKIAEKKEEDTPEEKSADKVSDKVSDLEKFLNTDLLGIVKDIRKLTEDILSILTKQSSADKKGSELFRRESEKKGKKSKEDKLEAKEEKRGLGLIEQVTKPFTSIFDTIKNFIMNVLMGSLVNWLFTVLQNPRMLLKPVQGLIDGIVGFFNNVIQFIDNMVVQPVRSFIDTINSALNGFIDILNGALKILPGSPQIGNVNLPNIPEPPELKGPDLTGEREKQEQAPQAPQGPPVNLKYTGGEIKQTILQKVTGGVIESFKNAPIIQKTTGGPVQNKKAAFDDQVSREGGNVSSKTTSFDITGLGPDKHLTALSTGEYVLKKGAADWLGGPAYLDGINKMFGGSSERRVASFGDIKIKGMASGGEIGSPTISIQSPGPKGGGPGPRAVSPPTSGSSGSGLKLLATNAKTTYYDPSLGGINASGAKTRDGLPATSTGEGYRPSVFSAAAFPPMIAKLPSENLARAAGFPGGKTVKKPLNVVVSNSVGKNAVVRINDVGPGVKGHSPNHMLDLSVAAKNFLGTGTGFKIEGPTTNRPGPLNGTAIAAATSGSASPDSSAVADSGAATSSGSPGDPAESPQFSDPKYFADAFKGDPVSKEYIASLPTPTPTATTTPGPKGGPKPSSSDLGYRVGRGLWGALSDLGPGLLGQIQGKDNDALRRQRVRGQKFLKLITTGKLDSPSKPKTPNPQSRSSAYSPLSSTSTSSSRESLTTTAKPSTVTKPAATPMLDPKLTAMQNWAKLYPTLAAKVKPGQSGYDEIQKVISPSSPAAPKIDPATGNVGTTKDAPAPPKIDPATGNVGTTKDAPPPPQSASVEKPGPKGQGNSSVRPRGNSKVSQHPAAKFVRGILSNTWKSISDSWTAANKVPGLSSYSPRSSRSRRSSARPSSPSSSRQNNPSTYSSLGSGSIISDTIESPSESPEVTKYMEAAGAASKSKDQSQMDKVRDMGLSIWAKANPKLAASLAERERTRGTSATTNPLMKGFKDRLPSPKTPSVGISSTGFDLSSKGTELSKPLQSLIPSNSQEIKYDSASKIKAGEANQYTQTKSEEKSSPIAPASNVTPTTPLIPPSSSTSASQQDLNKMPLDQLSKMLDPTQTGNSNKAVWEASQRARSEGKTQGLTGEALEKKVLVASIQAKQGQGATSSPIAASNITSPSKPSIPGPPESKPNISALPLPPPPQGSKPQGDGATAGASTPTVVFSSFNMNESSIVTTAALYNIWGM